MNSYLAVFVTEEPEQRVFRGQSLFWFIRIEIGQFAFACVTWAQRPYQPFGVAPAVKARVSVFAREHLYEAVGRHLTEPKVHLPTRRQLFEQSKLFTTQVLNQV